MALGVAASGSQACTVGTEHTLSTISTGKTLVLVCDVNPIVGGATPDILELRLKTKVLSGSTSRLAYFATYVGGMIAQPNVYSIPVPANQELVATMKQIQGTGRTVDWALLSLD